MNRDISWPRILAEAAAIVASILLAFAIEAQWQNYLSRTEEKSVLSSVREEIDINLDTLDKQRFYHENIVSVVKKLFAASDGVVSLNPNDLDGLILEVTFWARSGFAMGAIDSLSQGSSFLSVDDIELRAKLIDLQTLYRWVDEMERREENYSTDYLNPFLARNAFLPQIASSTTAQYAGVITEATGGWAKGEGADHTHLLDNDEFLGMLVQEKWNHEDTIQNFDGLKSLMLEVRAMIDIRLRD